jgi:oxaloacetate decarboxylase gamma subunit
MTILDMLGQSAVLTVLGMGVVFGFLIIMVICVSVMGKIIQNLGGNKDLAETAAPSPQTGIAGTAEAGKAVIAAITAAVTQYQKDNS